MEEGGKILFLDMNINHIGNSIRSMWYVKPTDLGLIMNYHALARNDTKDLLFKALSIEYIGVYSSWELVKSSLQREKEVLDKNQYPKKWPSG